MESAFWNGLRPSCCMSSLRAEVRTIATLAVPVALGQLALMSMGIVDAMMVGRVDAGQMASVGLAVTWYFGSLVLFFGILAALDPVFSQAHGAGDEEGKSSALRHAVLLALLLAPFPMALQWAAPWALRALGEPPELLPVAVQFCRITSFAVPGLLVSLVLRAFLQAQGLMRPATVAILVANVANACIDYVLVFGHFGAPALGGLGAACSTLTCQYVQLGVLAYAGRHEIARAWRGFSGRIEAARLVALTRAGIPVGLQIGTESWAFQAGTVLAGWLGTAELAAHGVVLNLASLAFMVPLGVSSAAATRVGNLIGAGEPWTASVLASLIVGVGAMSLSASAYAFLPTVIAGWFTPDVHVVALAAGILPLAAAFQLFDGTQVVCFGILRGAGDTRVGAVVNLVGYWALGLPVGAWLAFSRGWGLAGLWTGLAIGLGSVATLLLVRVRWTMARGGFRVSWDGRSGTVT